MRRRRTRRAGAKETEEDWNGGVQEEEEWKGGGTGEAIAQEKWP